MIGAVAIGLAGGVVAGLLGVGGGVLFVPGLVIFLGLGQHQAEATSLLAIIPVALVGTYRQDRYGHVRRHDALVLGLLSVAGAAGGVALANVLSGSVLRDAFAALMVLIAVQLVHRTLSASNDAAAAAKRPSTPGASDDAAPAPKLPSSSDAAPASKRPSTLGASDGPTPTQDRPSSGGRDALD